MRAGAARTAEGLNPAQRAAIERWGQDVCVVAGPGSGKTRVLIERFRWLVEEKGVAPGRILAVTFTEKAATEIKRRLLEAFAGAAGGVREQIERAWVSTIHGFCTRLLRENALAAGVDPDFKLLEEAQARLLQLECADRVLDRLLEEQPGPVRTVLLELDTAGSGWAEALLDLYEEARSAGVPVVRISEPQPPDVEAAWAQVRELARAALEEPAQGSPSQRESQQRLHAWCREALSLRIAEDWLAPLRLFDLLPAASKLKSGSKARWAVEQLQDAALPRTCAALVLRNHSGLYGLCLEALRRIDKEYRDAKRRQAAMDFDDLQETAIGLLEADAALQERVRGQFEQVLLDELQDTNRLQWRLIELVARPGRLFAVGDVNQSIYYFRHADPEVFRRYRDRLEQSGAVVDQLRENYRSRGEILSAVNAVSRYLIEGVERHELRAQRAFQGGGEPAVECVHTFAEREGQDAAEAEARWIAQRILELEGSLRVGRTGEGRRLRRGDFAVLARTNQTLIPVQRALERAGIATVVNGGRSFFESREVIDLVSWLRVLADPLDDANLLVLLRSPLLGVSDDVIVGLSGKEGGLWRAIEAAGHGDGSSDWLRLAWFRDLVNRQRRNAHWQFPDEMLAEAVDQSSYAVGLSERACANVAKLMDLLRRETRGGVLGLGRLVAHLERLRRAAREPEPAGGEPSDAVRLLTVHAAKGLEFPVVFLAGMRRGAQNRDPVFCFGEQGTLGARWRHPEGGRAISDPVHLEVCRTKRRQQEGEEDRLLYVAMTRAEEHLAFTASPGGSGSWWKRIAEAFGLETGHPNKAFSGSQTLLDGTRISVRYVGAGEGQPAAPGAPGRQERGEPAADAERWLDEEPPRESFPCQEAVVPVTSVAQHAFCPRQYFLERFLGLGQAARPTHGIEDGEQETADLVEWTASEFGTIVHELLAGKRSAAESPAEAVELARVFADSEWGRRAERAAAREREFDFLLAVEGIIVRGQIDLWFEEGGDLVLVDFKTDEVAQGEEGRRAFRYGPQMRLYAMALERLRGRPVTRALLFFLRTGVTVPVSLAPERMEEARAAVARLRDGQAQLAFPLREGAHCAHCQFFRGACPASLEAGFKEPDAAPTREV